MANISQLEKVRKIAKQYIRKGWKVVLIPTGQKYPDIKGWQHLDIKEEEVEQYFDESHLNIGILTGSPSGNILVLDLDITPWKQQWHDKTKYPWGDTEWDSLTSDDQKKHKENKYLFDYECKYGHLDHNVNGSGSSLNTWQGWLDKYNDGKPLETPTSQTGSGGRQMVVRIPSNVQLTQSSKHIHPSMDTRTTGGQVVVSPSIHPNGKQYRWLINPDIPVIDCPEWLLAKLQGSNWRDEFRNGETAIDFSGDTSLDSYMESLWKSRHKGNSVKELDESDAPIQSGHGRKKALCSIAGYWSSQGLSGEELVQKVLPHLSRMETDPTDPVDEKRVRNICKWIDLHEQKSSQTHSTTVDTQLQTYFRGYESYPLDSFPDTVQEYITQCSIQKNVPVEFLGGGILSVYAGAIGTTYGIQLYPWWKENPILWHVVLADTGSRKTASFHAVWDIARDKERDLNRHNQLLEKEFRREQLLYDKAVSQYKNENANLPSAPERPTKRILRITDTTYESAASILASNPYGTGIYRDEIWGWIKGAQYIGNSDSARRFYLESYDGYSYNINRVGTGYAYIPRNHIHVWGYTQPKYYQRMLQDENDVDDGFAPRIMVCQPDPLPLCRRTNAPDANLLSRLQSIYGTLADQEPDYADPHQKHNPITRYLTFDDQAQTRWDTFYDQYIVLNNQHILGSHHPFIPWWSKHLGQTARLIEVLNGLVRGKGEGI